MDFVTGVQAQLDAHNEVRRFNVAANLEDETIVLTGMVPTYYMKQMAGEIAMRFLGDRCRVSNKVMVQ